MKPFEESSKSLPPLRLPGPRSSTANSRDAQRCAGLLLETVPQIMRAMRLAIRTVDAPLTVPQFRTLHFVQSHVGPSLSATSDFLGLSLPSTSKLVDHLVRAGLLARDNDASDRRRMTLRLTAEGDALLQGAQLSVRRRLAEMLTRFAPPDLAALHKALGLLQESFPPLSVSPAASADLASQDGSRGNGHGEPPSIIPARAAAS